MLSRGQPRANVHPMGFIWTSWVVLAAIQSNADAVRAIAEATEEAPQAVRYLRNKGRPGLWALYGAAKRAEGEERVRLLSAVGQLPMKGAEWSLRQAYQKGDRDSQLGALQGMLQLPDSVGIRATLVAAAESPSPKVQELAAEGLAARFDIMEEQVSRMLLEADVPQRRTAIRVARLHEDPRFRTKAIDVGLSDTRPVIQVETLELIGETRDMHYLQPVTDRIRSPDTAVSAAATDALVSMDGPTAVARLSRLLADPSLSFRTKTMIAERLRASDATGFDALVQGLAAAPDGPEFIEEHLSETDVPAAEQQRWVQMLASPRQRVQAVTVAALDAIGPRVHPLLVRQLAAPEPEMRARALAFLSTRVDERLMAELKRASRADSATLRAGALTARIRLAQSPEELESLLFGLDDPAVRVQVAVARGLAASALPSIDRELEARLDSMEGPVKRALLEGAANRPDPSVARGWAMAMLRADQPDVRRAAVRVLTPAPSEASIQALEAYLRTAPPAEKVFAVEAIGTSRVPGAGQLLVELVTDPDPEVRKAALAYTESI